MNDLTHSVLDVKGDGNCFYRAILKSIANDYDTLEVFGLAPDETVASAIEKLRRMICDCILNDVTTKKWILDFHRLSQSHASVLEDFPALKKTFKTHETQSEKDRCENNFLDMLCQEIGTDRTWASQIEISILHERLKIFCNIHLIVIKARHKNQILQTFKIEKQLLIFINKIYDEASNDEKMSIRCLVLIQINNNHYMYLVLQRLGASITLPPIQALQLYLDDLLENCSDDEDITYDENISYDDDIGFEFSAFQLQNTSEFCDFQDSAKNDDIWTSDTFGLSGAEEHYKQEYEMARKFL